MADLNVQVDRASDVPAYKQLYRQISELIREGILPAGTYLPKIRAFAQQLGIARNTVEAAYKQLALEGYATGHRGKGYLVEEMDLSSLTALHAQRTTDAKLDAKPTAPGRNPLGDNLGCRYDFSYGNRSPKDFPMQLWRTHAEKVLTKGYAELAASYMDPFGLPALRQQLCTYLGETRNVACEPRQIVLLPGTQTALSRICGLFPPEERVAAMEEPGYNAALNVFNSCGWEVASVPTHKSAQALVAGASKSGARLMFCTPSNQFPLGYTLPIATRLELIGWAKRTGAYIVEDDYCCEYRYDGSSPIPSLQSLDPDHVIYMGTLSKILTPAVRISFVVIPPDLLATWERTHGHFHCPVDWMSQAVLQSLMASGDWHRHVRATTNLYHHRHALLMEAIERELGDRVKLMGENAGLHLLAGDKEGRSQAQLIKLARANDVRVYETASYWMHKNHPMDNFVLVGFSAIDDDDIAPGIRALATAWYA